MPAADRSSISFDEVETYATSIFPASFPSARCSFRHSPSTAARNPPPAPVARPSPAVTLPIREVSLYKNGIAFLQQFGSVTGDALVRIDFTTAQLNDVLQSLTAIDLGGGKITGLGYGTSATLQEQLHAIAPGLGDDPTVLDFLKAIKGARVEVHGGPASGLTGKVLNIEVRSQTGPSGPLKTGAVPE
jgi:hypothetical protein